MKRGDVLIQSSEVAGQWLVTVAVYASSDPREGPLFVQVAASLHKDKTTARAAAVQQWLDSEAAL